MAGKHGENPNKSLEGIKTKSYSFLKFADITVKTLINPWKGLKHVNAEIAEFSVIVKTLINPWKGLKPI